MKANLLKHFRTADDRNATFFVLLVYPFLDLGNAGVLFADLLLASESEVTVDPASDTCEARSVRYRNGSGSAKDQLGIKDVVDLLVL